MEIAETSLGKVGEELISLVISTSAAIRPEEESAV